MKVLLRSFGDDLLLCFTVVPCRALTFISTLLCSDILYVNVYDLIWSVAVACHYPHTLELIIYMANVFTSTHLSPPSIFHLFVHKFYGQVKCT